jgi:HTH-type transcriptional regulator/antitoxin HigA
MPAEVFPPGEFLKEELEARGLGQIDLADILGKPAKTVNEIIQGKRRITPDMARLLGDALGTSASLWLNLDSAYELYQAECARPRDAGVAARAELYSRYPVRAMLKRGWIEPADEAQVLQRQLEAFHQPPFPFAARKRDDPAKAPMQAAWLYRTFHLARAMEAPDYSPAKLDHAFANLKAQLAADDQVKNIPRILQRAGIRLLIVEALPGAKIDGICYWLNDASPVIALSLRYDRIDYFWFTLLHELQHLKLGHGKVRPFLDTEVMASDAISREERQANAGATAFLVPQEALEALTTGPASVLSAASIRRIAAESRIHPGIIVGQLQHCGRIPYTHHRRMLVPVRSILRQTALLDGWGVIA